MSRNAEYLSTMETQLKQWDADLDALAAEGDKAGAEARKAYQEQITHLRAGRDAAQETFKEMQLATVAAGAQMHARMQVAWETMHKALQKVSSDLRK